MPVTRMPVVRQLRVRVHWQGGPSLRLALSRGALPWPGAAACLMWHCGCGASNLPGPSTPESDACGMRCLPPGPPSQYALWAFARLPLALRTVLPLCAEHTPPPRHAQPARRSQRASCRPGLGMPRPAATRTPTGSGVCTLSEGPACQRLPAAGAIAAGL